MPIYMPWLSIATSVLSVIATVLAIIRCAWIVPIYAACSVSLVILSKLSIIRLPRSVVFLLLFPILVFLYASCRAVRPAENDLSNYINKNIVFQAVLLDTPKICNSFNLTNCTATIQALTLLFPEQQPLSGKARLTIIGCAKYPIPQFKASQIIQIEGRVRSIDTKKKPWLSGRKRASERNSIYSQVCIRTSNIKISIDASEYVSAPGNVLTNKINSLIDQVRSQITNQHLSNLGPKAGSLLSSIVLGDRAVKLDENILNAFRKVGLSHIVAASGFNLTIVTAITWWLLRKISAHRLGLTLMGCTNVILYAILAGLSASIVRSAIACLLLLIVQFYYRKVHTMAALAIVLLINILADPAILLDLGAQLSYAAVAGILLGAKPLTKLLSCGNEHKIVNVFAASLAVILLAQMSVLPIQLYHFWQASFLFLPANLLVDPLIAPVTVIGFASSFAALLNLGSICLGSIICRLLDLLAYIPLQIIIYITEKLSSLNLASINTGQPALHLIGIYYLALMFFLTTLAKEKHRRVSLALFLVALFCLFHKPDLKQPLIIFLPNSTIAINTERKALCLGNQSTQTNKILSFYGAQLLSAAYNADKTFRFVLSAKASASISINKETQENGFLLNVTPENNNLPKTYLISSDRYRPYQRQSNSSLPLVSSISLAQFSKDLPIEIQICCPQNSVNISIPTPNGNDKI